MKDINWTVKRDQLVELGIVFQDSQFANVICWNTEEKRGQKRATKFGLKDDKYSYLNTASMNKIIKALLSYSSFRTQTVT